MSSYLSVFLSEKVLNNVFVNGSNAINNSTLYAALFFDGGTTETNLRGNTPIDEVNDASYSRIALGAAASFNVAVSDTNGMYIDNKVKITFPTAAANYSNNVGYVALFDLSIGGNVLMYASITSTAVNVSEYVEVDIGSFKVNM